MASWGLLALSGLLQNWTATRDLGFQAEWFRHDGLAPVFEWVQAFAQRYHSAPQWAEVCEQFPELPGDPPAPTEPLAYYRDRLWQQWIQMDRLADLPTYEEWANPEEALQKLQAFVQTVTPPAPVVAKDMVQNVLDRAMHYADYAGENILSSGDTATDEVLGGWLRGDYIVSAAPWHTGKTWIALAWALAFWRHHRQPILFCNLEISPEEFAARWDALEGQFDYQTLIRGTHAGADTEAFAHNLLTYGTTMLQAHADQTDPFYVIHHRDLPGLLTPELTYRLGVLYRPALIIIDQLSWMAPDERAVSIREQYVKISRGLHQVANSLQVPIILNAQIGESGEIQESRNLYQDATAVVKWKRRADGILAGKVVKSHVINIHKDPLNLVAHLDIGHPLGVWFGSQVAEPDEED